MPENVFRSLDVPLRSRTHLLQIRVGLSVPLVHDYALMLLIAVMIELPVVLIKSLIHPDRCLNSSSDDTLRDLSTL